ncbi:MAG: metallophosphoesterase family protein [Bacteroidales bacterium]|nr:metallophosphoesterase family protein [Bacteroidales bacterium]
MVKVGVLSDTHGVLLESVERFFEKCDYIIHAGDVGNIEILDALSKKAKLFAVYGNIDGTEVRSQYPEHQSFMIEDALILLMHIGGYPPKYNANSKLLIEKYKPDLFITGHSHILRVMYEKKYQHLYINPGAAGKFGFHAKITAVRFDIQGKRFENLEVLDIVK